MPHILGKPPAEVPPLAIDLNASEVSSDIGDAETHRATIAEILESLTAQQGSARKPARFRAKVRGSTNYGLLAVATFTYCLAYVGALYNCTYTSLDRSVDLEIEVDGVRYAGTGWSNRFASTWVNTQGYHSLKEATESALRRGVEAGGFRVKPSNAGESP